MTRSMMPAVALVAEIADALARHGELPCEPLVDRQSDGAWVLTLTFRPTGNQQAFEALAAADDLQHVANLAQLRALATEYGLDEDALEPFVAAARRRVE